MACHFAREGRGSLHHRYVQQQQTRERPRVWIGELTAIRHRPGATAASRAMSIDAPGLSLQSLRGPHFQVTARRSVVFPGLVSQILTMLTQAPKPRQLLRIP